MSTRKKKYRSFLNIIDGGFLILEALSGPKHVGCLQILRLPPAAEPSEFVSSLVHELRQPRPVPPFSCRPRWAPWPRWEEVTVDLNYHVRHLSLPAPGTDESLVELVTSIHTNPLDKSRPLWECCLIEGLQGGRFAFYMKTHHACIDGVSAMMRAVRSLRVSPEDEKVEPIWDTELSQRTKKSTGGRAHQTHRRHQAWFTTLADLNRLIGQMALRQVGLRLGPRNLPFCTERNRFNLRPGPQRRVAVQSLPLARLKAVGQATGTTVNDVILSLVDAAAQEYLNERQERSRKPLLALVPFSFRQADDTRATNQVSLLTVPLGTPEATASQRLDQIRRASAEVKKEALALSPAASQALTYAATVIAQVLDLTHLGAVIPPVANLLVSNIPGPDQALFLRGAQLEGFFPLSTLLPNQSLNITVLSYHGFLHFGFVGCREAWSDLEQFAVGLETALTALEESVFHRPESRPAEKSKRGSLHDSRRINAGQSNHVVTG